MEAEKCIAIPKESIVTSLTINKYKIIITIRISYCEEEIFVILNECQRKDKYYNFRPIGLSLWIDDKIYEDIISIKNIISEKYKFPYNSEKRIKIILSQN